MRHPIPPAELPGQGPETLANFAARQVHNEQLEREDERFSQKGGATTLLTQIFRLNQSDSVRRQKTYTPPYVNTLTGNSLLSSEVNLHVRLKDGSWQQRLCFGPHLVEYGPGGLFYDLAQSLRPFDLVLEAIQKIRPNVVFTVRDVWRILSGGTEARYLSHDEGLPLEGYSLIRREGQALNQDADLELPDDEWSFTLLDFRYEKDSFNKVVALLYRHSSNHASHEDQRPMDGITERQRSKHTGTEIGGATQVALSAFHPRNRNM